MKASKQKLMLKLADFVEKLPKDKFNMYTTMGRSGQEGQDVEFVPFEDVGKLADDVMEVKPICGSAGCMLGWATTMPEFRRLGMRLVRYAPPGLSMVIPYAAISDVKHPDLTGIDIVVKLFGIDADEADKLFFSGMGINAKQGAARLRKFVAQKAAA